jgi:ribosomal protein S18 acetylase RimI-like enzyme
MIQTPDQQNANSPTAQDEECPIRIHKHQISKLHMPTFHFDSHDSLPTDATAIVEHGLSEFSNHAAPLHEVQPLSCFVRDASGQVIGGAIGRRWGGLCELQQLWVAESHRGLGLGRSLVGEFERHAASRGCRSLYLETLSYQAPDFYRKLGYTVAWTNTNYPHGILKYYMVKEIGLPPDN